jgi:DNA-binding XRE family transcriptional regulator
MKPFRGLQSIRPTGTLTIEVTFEGGEMLGVDLGPWIGAVPLLQPLRDPALFATVRVAYGGAGVAWGELLHSDGEGPIDMDGEQLWRLAGEQSGQLMPTAEFRAWRARHGLTIAKTAEALGLSPKAVANYESGVNAIPRTVMLACRGWDALVAEAA